MLVQEAWETLRDADKRQAYDQKLAAEQSREAAGGFVSEELEVGEMEEFDDDDEQGWRYACRCGESFTVVRCELPEEGSEILINCDGCSLRARVRRGGPKR